MALVVDIKRQTDVAIDVKSDYDHGLYRDLLV